MPLAGTIRKKTVGSEMSPTIPVTGRTTTGTSTPATPIIVKKKADTTQPLRKAVNEDTETLTDSQPIGADLFTGFGGTGILATPIAGGFSIGTILLVVLFGAVGYLFLKRK